MEGKKKEKVKKIRKGPRNKPFWDCVWTLWGVDCIVKVRPCVKQRAGAHSFADHGTAKRSPSQLVFWPLLHSPFPSHFGACLRTRNIHSSATRLQSQSSSWAKTLSDPAARHRERHSNGLPAGRPFSCFPSPSRVFPILLDVFPFFFSILSLLSLCRLISPASSASPLFLWDPSLTKGVLRALQSVCGSPCSIPLVHSTSAAQPINRKLRLVGFDLLNLRDIATTLAVRNKLFLFGLRP